MSYSAEPPDSPPYEREPLCPRCDAFLHWDGVSWTCISDPTQRDVLSGDYAERPDGTLVCIGRLEASVDERSYDEMCEEDR